MRVVFSHFVTQASANDVAEAHMSEKANAWGLTQADIADKEISKQYESTHNGVTHIYYRQMLSGIPVANGVMNINIKNDQGRPFGGGSSFVGELQKRVNIRNPSLGHLEAIQAAAAHLGLLISEDLEFIERPKGSTKKAICSTGGISISPIPISLAYWNTDSNEKKDGVRLAWDLVIEETSEEHWWNLWVDAVTGQVLDQNDWVDGFSYEVFALPKESPLDGPRTIEVDPWDLAASPFGWHDTNGIAGAEFPTETRGNNVIARADLSGSNGGSVGTANSPAGDFESPIDETQDPTTYVNAAVTNLFYWNNVLHDILYRYGFDEVAGNFQDNNYGHGGFGSDAVYADALDGGGTNNANFRTPPDGNNPRMQMYIWTYSSPRRTSDFDAGVIAHEYCHVSTHHDICGWPSFNLAFKQNNGKLKMAHRLFFLVN